MTNFSFTFVFSMLQQRLVDQAFLIIETSLTHTHTTPDRTPLVE